jgi:hypothetical protein
MKIGRIYNFHGPFSKNNPKKPPSGIVEEHTYYLGGKHITRAGHVHFDKENCNLCNKPLEGSSYVCKTRWTRWVQDNSGLVTVDRMILDDGKYASAFVLEEGSPSQNCCFKCFEWNTKQDELALDVAGCYLCQKPINKSRNVCQEHWKGEDNMITGLVMANRKPVVLPKDGRTPFVCSPCSDRHTLIDYKQKKIVPMVNDETRKQASRAKKALFETPCHLCTKVVELSQRLCRTGDFELVKTHLGLWMEAQTAITIAEGAEHRICEDCFDRNSAKRIGRKQYQPAKAKRRYRNKEKQQRHDLSGRGLSSAADAARRHK